MQWKELKLIGNRNSNQFLTRELQDVLEMDQDLFSKSNNMFQNKGFSQYEIAYWTWKPEHQPILNIV